MEQFVRHAAHRGYDDTDLAVRHAGDYVGHSRKAIRVSKAAAAELMNLPVLARHD